MFTQDLKKTCSNNLRQDFEDRIGKFVESLVTEFMFVQMFQNFEVFECFLEFADDCNGRKPKIEVEGTFFRQIIDEQFLNYSD